MGNESSVGGGDSSQKNVQHHGSSGGRRLGNGLVDSSSNIGDEAVISESNLGERKTFRDEYMLQSRIGERAKAYELGSRER